MLPRAHTFSSRPFLWCGASPSRRAVTPSHRSSSAASPLPHPGNRPATSGRSATAGRPEARPRSRTGRCRRPACWPSRIGRPRRALRRPGPGGEGSEEAQDRQTPLHMAATWGLEQVVAALIEHGANTNAQVAKQSKRFATDRRDGAARCGAHALRTSSIRCNGRPVGRSVLGRGREMSGARSGRESSDGDSASASASRRRQSVREGPERTESVRVRDASEEQQGGAGDPRPRTACRQSGELATFFPNRYVPRPILIRDSS